MRWLLLFSIAFAAGPGRAAPSPSAPVGPTYVLALANSESFDRALSVQRYPHDDLARLTKVLTRTGLVPDDHVVALKEATTRTVRAAFADVAKRAQSAGAGARFIFYYTGHSDATGLHLADAILGKSELHKLIKAVPAAARIAFFDGCYSGALAAKGVKPGPGFVVPKAEFDQPSGSVFLAATSGEDVAFEVEELAGSLFTHNLVDGLYGAADLNRDGLVTIDELYQHVYSRMASYAASLPYQRSQKPEYDVDLQGKGALVVSYLDRTTAVATLGASLLGEVTLAADGGLQSFRLAKAERRPLSIALVPGEYGVTVKDGSEVGRGTLKVTADGKARLERADLRYERVSQLDLVAKGQRPNARLAAGVGVGLSSYAKPGPQVELAASTPAVRVERTEWRGLAAVGAHANELAYRGQGGKQKAATALLAGVGSLPVPFGLSGQEWQALVGFGTDYAWQRWEDGGERAFDAAIPKVAVGFGSQFTRAGGSAWSLAFRREFLFAKERSSGDVLAFGANVFLLSFVF
jgi:hypothetical protein